ncbi:hypothetical protein [Viridibacillus arvi]|uniref:hypothetical protein n=1 Tax=Viridibacillus arvi TaxID=263475 RepID=UPI0034CE33CE
MSFSKLIENTVTKKANPKAEELGIEFKVKHYVKEGGNSVLVRIKQDILSCKENLTDDEIKVSKELIHKQRQFAHYITKIIVPKYSYDVKFSYPIYL